MSRVIGIIGAFDTKADELLFVRDEIVRLGQETLLIDTGIFQSQITADITAEEVARAGGGELTSIRATRDKAASMSAMTNGAAIVAKELYSSDRIGGLIGLGGTAGTAIAANAMRALPIGVPKILVSTVASGDTSAYVGVKDLTLMYSVVDIAGLNRISRAVLSNAAAAAAGMARASTVEPGTRPLIAASMFGNTTACVDRARAALEKAGNEVLVFHATGAGGRTMESLIGDGFIAASLDLTTTELADDLCGGVFSAGPARLDAAAQSSIPQVIAPGCLDMVNFWARATVPAQLAERKLYEWNPNVTLMRTTPEENAELGRRLARKANASRAPTLIMLPMRGVSQLDSEGGAFWWPEADKALFDAIRSEATGGTRVMELDCNINDPEFADTASRELLYMLSARSREGAAAE